MNPTNPTNPNQGFSQPPQPVPNAGNYPPVASETPIVPPQATVDTAPPPPPQTQPPVSPPVSAAPPVYEQGTPTVTTPSNSGGSKKIFVILGVVLLLVVLGVGGYLLASNFLTPSSEQTAEPSPVAEEISAMCVTIKAYDNEWNRLTIEDLPSLQPGDTVRFAVEGNTSAGDFDKARFSVNAVSLGETVQQHPETGEFYDEYIIPQDLETFSVEAQLHHVTLDQWI